MKKRSILMISDHVLSASGVGTQGRYLTHGLVATGKYSFKCLGAAIRHASYDVAQPHPDIVIKPIDGFGNRDMLRVLLATERPDALLLFNDPRFFIYVWEMEEEIRQICPIVYNHLWDNDPVPSYNKVLYEATDLINCINYDTYKFVHNWFPEKTNYVPHAVPKDLFCPLPDGVKKQIRSQVVKNKENSEFVVMWINRNARRKMPGDLLCGWKAFLDQLEEKKGHRKATLLMHTDPFDQEGPNLEHVVDMLGIRDNVVFSRSQATFQDVNALYNCADAVINVSCNEGFGLGTLEALYAGVPIIVNATGGLKRQVRNPYDGSLNGIEMIPDVRSLVGTQMIPFIYEDFVSHKKIADSLYEMYDIGPEKRKEIGKRGREYVHEEYNMDKMIKQWDESLTKTIDNFKFKQSWKKVTL